MSIFNPKDDANAIRAALQPLIDGAEDKALAQLHAEVIVATTMFGQKADALLDKLPDLSSGIVITPVIRPKS